MARQRDVVSWNSVIAGDGIHGFGRETVVLFEEMVDYGLSPCPITFLSVLGACSHARLVREGKRLFASMSWEYV